MGWGEDFSMCAEQLHESLVYSHLLKRKNAMLVNRCITCHLYLSNLNLVDLFSSEKFPLDLTLSFSFPLRLKEKKVSNSKFYS